MLITEQYHSIVPKQNANHGNTDERLPKFHIGDNNKFLSLKKKTLKVLTVSMPKAILQLHVVKNLSISP